MDVPPRATPQEHSDHTGGKGGADVVVQPIAHDAISLAGHPHSATIRSKNSGEGFSTFHPADVAMRSTGRLSGYDF